MALAHTLGDRLAPHYRLLAPVRLNVVCFTLADNPTTARINALIHNTAAAGEIFLTPTVYDGTPALRAAFSNWRTTEADLDRITAALTKETGLCDRP